MNLRCTVCKAQFWMPKKQRSRKQLNINGMLYCAPCGEAKRRRDRKMTLLNKNCAIRKVSPMVGKIVVVPPARPL